MADDPFGIAPLLDGFSSAAPDPSLPDTEPVRDIFAVAKRKAWDTRIEARCNFERHPAITRRAGVWFLSLWRKSVTGRTLSDIKSDPAEVEHFASAVSDFIVDVLGANLAAGGWGICTTPKRRHKVNNFAAAIAAGIAARVGIPFTDDVAACRSRQRVGAVFDLVNMPPQPNLLVFDDFVTTGSTLAAMNTLLAPLGKNIIFVSGINNAL